MKKCEAVPLKLKQADYDDFLVTRLNNSPSLKCKKISPDESEAVWNSTLRQAQG